MAVSSDGVAWSRITAGRSYTHVCLRRALSAAAWDRSHLLCHWLQDHLHAKAARRSWRPKARHDLRQAPGGKRQVMVGRPGLIDLLDLPPLRQGELRRNAYHGSAGRELACVTRPARHQPVPHHHRNAGSGQRRQGRSRTAARGSCLFLSPLWSPLEAVGAAACTTRSGRC